MSESSSDTQRIPKFEPQIPNHLIEGLSKTDQWLCQCMSVQKQQNEWLIERAIKTDQRHREADKRMQELDARLKPFENRWVVLTAKWSIVAIIVGGLAVPVMLVWFASWLNHFYTKSP
jgi:hypothetical protein